MNNLIKDRIREKKNNIKSLDLKRDNIKDKMNMQKKFITELEDMGKQNIETVSYTHLTLPTKA